jgi:clan AA aspartic protease (TIGR02281 family)
MALDTGASQSVIRSDALIHAGYDLARVTQFRTIVTASGVDRAAKLTVDRLTALDSSVTNMDVLAQNLPPRARVHGLLGLDFLRGRRLTIDFRAGMINLD